MVYKLLLSLLLSATFAFGVSDRAKEIKGLYKSLAKDFVIYEFIKKKSTTKEDAKYLYSDIHRMTNRLKKAFYKKINNKELIYPNVCAKLKGKEYVKKCAYIGITPRKFEKLSYKRQKATYQKIRKKYKKDTFWVKAMVAKDTFKTLSYGSGYDFLKVFFSVSDRYKRKVLDKPLNYKFLTRLANQKRFYRLVMHVAMSNKYKNLPKSLLNVNPKRKRLSYNSAFYLGLIALKQGKEGRAIEYFKRAKNETKSKANRDRATFWEYLVTKDREKLVKLGYSSDLSFYTLYAREKLNLSNFTIINPKPTKKYLDDYNITNPFDWAKTLDYSKKLNKKQKESFASKFYTIQTLPQYTYLLERASKFTKYYYITPFEEILKDVDRKRKILIYSIARQESRFVPASVSTSYALGLMQFMPFLARATAKEQKIKKFNYFDMFKPEIALKFANVHLDYLQENLHSPLFVAYAYNGGIGFTRGLINKRKLFKKGKYEPFLSMELVHYSESRKYAKKVLANYVIYSKMYGLNISLNSLIKDITNLNKSKVYKRN